MFGEITRNDAAGSTRANNDDIVGFLGHQCVSLSPWLHRHVNSRSRGAIVVPDAKISWTGLRK
jgi:hypothetical protein